MSTVSIAPKPEVAPLKTKTSPFWTSHTHQEKQKENVTLPVFPVSKKILALPLGEMQPR